jgi:urease accessory protein
MTATATDWLPALLQTSDPLFPTGAYAHSGGLEEMVRLGLVRDESSLEAYLKTHLLPVLQNLELPYLHFSYVAVKENNFDHLLALSREINAWKLPAEARSASLQVGSRRLESARRIFPHPAWEKTLALHLPPHHLTVYALQMALCGVPLEAALMGYAYQTLSGAGSAALKLIRIGQDGVQRTLAAALVDIGNVVTLALTVKRPDAGWFNPLLEIAAMRHAQADERLFIS